jgi:molybdenum cofactor guanylyltransferase
MALRPSALNQITGLILAGGRGSRMHNLDKGLQLLDGRALVAHVIARLSPQVDHLAISANRHIDEYADFGYPVWSDEGFQSDQKNAPEFRGPLAGVEAGLLRCTTPYLLVVPCDSPFLPSDIAHRLMTALLNAGADIVVVCTGSPAYPQRQPVFCLLRTSVRAQLQHYLQSGGRKMDGWYGNASVVQVFFEDEAAFRNINSLDDLKASSSGNPM